MYPVTTMLGGSHELGDVSTYYWPEFTTGLTGRYTKVNGDAIEGNDEVPWGLSFHITSIIFACSVTK